MRLSSSIIVFSVYVTAAAAAVLVASFAAEAIERFSTHSISKALEEGEFDWVHVSSDGLQVRLSGTAPTEADRFRALSVAGSIVDAHRVIDRMEVQAAAEIAAPRFSVEILRNGDGISLIGLIPTGTNRDQVVTKIEEIADGTHVTDMLESADHPVPEGWESALSFGLDALGSLPRSKISVDADLVAITAISNSAAEREQLEANLLQRVPDGLEVVLDISAPRPVITPFTLRYLINDGVGSFDACSADSQTTIDQILAAARASGLQGDAECVIGLGNPSPKWGSAVAIGVKALAEIGGGSITFSDADVTLVALDTTPQALFDRVAGELETDLPDVFSLHAVLPDPVEIDGTGEGQGPPEFVATRSPEGLIQLRGRLTDERVRSAVESYARARFGMDQVYAATRLDAELPDGWPVRVLAALEALAELNHGSIVVQPDFVEVRGTTGHPEARANISRILSEKLGEAENFGVEVTYEETLDPIAALPTPEECVDGINAVLAETKITYAPGAATIAAGAGRTLDKIADIMRDCQDVKMEIAGHTDSQGRETMNQNLSQGRAEAVLSALMARRVLTSNLEAKGYGESTPIADNDTEEGREANRRIEFTLILPEEEPTQEAESATPTAVANETEAAATGTEDEQN